VLYWRLLVQSNIASREMESVVFLDAREELRRWDRLCYWSMVLEAQLVRRPVAERSAIA
jgi:hypothetical protein